MTTTTTTKTTPIPTMEQYRKQRHLRQTKRKQYLTLFESLREKMGLKDTQQLLMINQNVNSKMDEQVGLSTVTNSKDKMGIEITVGEGEGIVLDTVTIEQNKLLEQNTALKIKISQLDKQQRQKLEKFKNKIGTAKENYLNKIKEIKIDGLTQKNQVLTKIKKLEEQIDVSTKKNIEIQSVNSKIQQQWKKTEQTMQKYSSSIQQQYDQKLQQFDKIFNSSTEKIKQMENQFSDQDFVQITLKNNDMMDNIKAIAEKTQIDINQMVDSYKDLLKGKQQIVQQLFENNKMKEDEISKMRDLQQKLNSIFKKMSEQKNLYVKENQQMFSELMQIKKLLTQTMEQ